MWQTENGDRQQLQKHQEDSANGDQAADDAVERRDLAQQERAQQYAAQDLLRGDEIDIGGVHAPQGRVVEGMAASQWEDTQADYAGDGRPVETDAAAAGSSQRAASR